MLTQIRYIQSTPVSSCYNTQIKQIESTIDYNMMRILSLRSYQCGIDAKTVVSMGGEEWNGLDLTLGGGNHCSDLASRENLVDF